MKKIILTIILLLLTVLTLTGCQAQKQNNENYTIVTSFYPMYILTKNIASGIEGVNVQNMASQNVGCLHDYTLTTVDLIKVEKANAFIINGLGIETFIGKILETYSNINIIDASLQIGSLKTDEHGVNAHIWLDIDKYINQIENVEQGLSKIDSDHAVQYEKNAQLYKQKLENVKIDIKENTKNLKKCISFSESLEYLETMNLDIKTIQTDHENNGLSAETLSNVIKYVKDNNIKNIIIDKQDAQNNAQTVANETGAKIYVLDSGLSGSEELDSYINMMKSNLEIIKNMEE